MLEFDAARAQLLALAAPLVAESVALQAAHRQFLAEDVYAAQPLPPFAASVMDGYAARAADIQIGNAYAVSGTSRAGHTAPIWQPGCVLRIFTGAPLPAGCDSVIMQEQATRDGELVRFATLPQAGQHVRRAGCDMQAGHIALARATQLTAPTLALAAMTGRARVLVHRKARVQVLPTGDELIQLTGELPQSVPLAQRAAPLAASIFESNGVALHAMCTQVGAIASLAAPVADDPAAHRAGFAHALEACDVLVTIGGVSVGDHDHVPQVLQDLGIEVAFYKVAMKPGKPLLVGVDRSRGKIVLGLPGNPASALVTFALFGIPLLRKLHGDPAPVRPATVGTLDTEVRHAPGRLEFLRAHFDPTTRVFAPLANQQSGAVTSMAQANALLEMPGEIDTLSAGASVRGHLYCDIGLA